MVLEPKHNDIAYRCPTCGGMIRGFLGQFAFSADMLRLKCPSGDSELVATISADREKIRFEVPCLFCGQSHHFTVARSIVYGQRLFLLNCPYTNMDIAFIGPAAEVDGAIKASEGELSSLLGNMGLEKLSELQPEDMDPEEILPDARIYDIVRYVVKELEAEGEIDCPCHGGEYEISVGHEGIRVYCPACFASYLFRTDSVSAAEEFLSCQHLTLAPVPDQTP
jgi:predicted RNA-binding Zn-ribbon protein involved in translation (DUF1610 family)